MSQERFKALIYKKDLDRISGWVMAHPNLETGGDLFGFWTHTGSPIIQFVLGPGVNSKHNEFSFYQDKEFLVQSAEILINEYGLQHIGEWHSHHQIDLAKPSNGDINTVNSALHKHNFDKFLLCIANLEPVEDIDSFNTSLGAFLFEKSNSYYKTGAWVVLPEDSPIRMNLIQKYKWKKSFLHDPFHSESWRGNILETKLSDPTMISTKPIEISNHVWYRSFEGQALLRAVHNDLDESFQNLKMLIKPSEDIYFVFYDQQSKWRVDLPVDYPLSCPEIFLNDEKIEFINWDRRLSRELSRLIFNLNGI
ncbi:hypothetical protein [Acaryochloris marina]|uniref:JAB domain-containing protein n=1 Tax=Acaryochloris marina (strain MBIC 11017) TaxID=329726 RepID=A8ZML6_ACAM1|nr:hypothetical protein [Acaryochloris marina]ABW32427.1 hypothetical protein AM1_C0120 [Acaryochloris marina MBIC11017]